MEELQQKRKELEEKMSEELKEEETRWRKAMEIELKKGMDSKREEMNGGRGGT